MFRRIMTVLLCIVMLVPGVGSAAQLIGTGLLGPDAMANNLRVETVYASAGGVDMIQVYSLTDHNAATVWNAAQWGLDKANRACVTMSLLAPADVEAVWIRNGSAQDSVSHAINGYATRVDMYCLSQQADGSMRQVAAYAYQLDGTYNPYERSDYWQDGYQCLRLPYTAKDVSVVMLYVMDYALQNGADTVCISDVSVCGVGVYEPLTSILYPQATQTPVPVVPQATNTPYVDETAPYYATLLKKIATRTGPGTEYTEPGTYLTGGDTVEVISLVVDENDVSWVQLDFYVGTKRRRAYTGLNRVDAEAWRIPMEHPLGNKCYLDREVTPRMGPGTDYVRALENKATLPYGTDCVLLCYEGEWAQIELEVAGTPARMWVPRTSLYVW